MKVDLSQSIAILANVGVIASIVFLGIQVRDGSIQTRVNTNQYITSQLRDWEENIASDEMLADIVHRGLEDFSSLSSVEQMRFDLLMRSRLRIMSSQTLAQDVGISDFRPDSALAENVQRFLDEPGFVQWWSTTDRRGLTSRVLSLFEVVRNQSDEADPE